MAWRTRWAVVGLLITAMALGWSLMFCDSAPTSATVSLPVSAAEAGIDGTPFPNVGPVAAPFEEAISAPAILGSGRNEAGARAAAVRFLELSEDAVSMSPTQAGAVQRSIATVDFAEEFGSDAEQRMIELERSIPTGIVLRVAPIELRSVADGDDWMISVWYVQAITIVGESVVDDWRTVSYRLRWEEDTWKIAAFSSERGPMPGRGTQPPSATATQFEARLDGYSDEGLG